MWIDAGEVEVGGVAGPRRRAALEPGSRWRSVLDRGAAPAAAPGPRTRSAPANVAALIAADASGAPERAAAEHLHSPALPMTPHFLTGAELTSGELEELLARAEELKREPLRSDAWRDAAWP